MIRYYTANRDQLIFKQLRRGIDPKEIRMRLGLSSIDVVYKAMARYRRTLPVEILTDRRMTNVPKIADKTISHRRAKESTL